MKQDKIKLQNIPTNLITGFLGVGKTSAILNLMTQKPANEKWSVLVNEFGAVGIDGAIYKAKGVEVKEIPGGCMCCAAGVPLQVAVNRILKETRPQRLLIEPSGLGHPKRVLDTLQGEHFQSVLAMRSSICLVDPRNLSDSRYTTNENFIDQIAMADILVANKSDLCDDETLQLFDDYTDSLEPSRQAIIKTQFGQLDHNFLDFTSSTKHQAQYPFHHDKAYPQISSTGSSIRDGFKSVGLTFPPDIIFDFGKLNVLFSRLKERRIKAVMHTDKGWQVFNIQGEQKEIMSITSSEDNRLEVIGREIDDSALKETLKNQLRDCMTS
jgi:G3E family GTPase